MCIETKTKIKNRKKQQRRNKVTGRTYREMKKKLKTTTKYRAKYNEDEENHSHTPHIQKTQKLISIAMVTDNDRLLRRQ